MDTSAISYRVADFLKQHPPFHAVDEADLIALAANGRVRFHEANETIGALAVEDGAIVLEDGFAALLKVDQNTSASPYTA